MIFATKKSAPQPGLLAGLLPSPLINRRAAQALAVGALLTLSLHPAQAAGANYIDGGGTTLLSTSISPTITTATSYLNGDTLTFNGAAYTQTDDISSALNFNSLTFSNSGAVTINKGTGSNSVTLGATNGAVAPVVNLNNSGALNFALALSLANNTTFNGSGAGNDTFSGVLSGTGGVSAGKTGGMLILSGANTYSGGTTVTGGTLQLSGAGTLGATAGSLLVTGGILDLNATSQTVGPLNYNSNSTGGTILNNAGSGTSILTIGGGSFSSYSGKILDNNNAGASKVGLIITGSQTLAGNNSYSGGTTVNSVGSLILSSSAGAGTGGIVLTSANSNLELYNSSGLSISNAISGSGYVENLYTSATTVTFTGALSYTGNTYFKTAGSSFNFASTGNSSLSGVIGAFGSGLQKNEVSGGSIIKSGLGTLTLSGANAYTGGTSIQNGTLVLGTSSGSTVGSLASTGAVSLGSNLNTSGVFQLGDTSNLVNQTVTSLTTSGTGTANAVVGGNAAVSTLTINNSADDSYGGLLGGAGTNNNNLALTKSGAGTLTLSGVNTYTGATKVNAGALAVSSSGSLSSGNALTIMASGSATFANSGQTLGAVSNGNSLSFTSAAGTTTLGSLNGGITNFTASANIGGSFNSGTANIGGSGTFATINGGSATVGGTSAVGILSNGSLTNNGANGSITTLNGGALTLGNGDTTSVGSGTGLGTITGGGGLTKTGAGTLTLTGANSYTGTTTISAGTLLAGAGSPNGANGAFGNATSAIVLGDANTTSSNSSVSLLTGGAFLVSRNITVAGQATTGAYTLGGNTNSNSQFSGPVFISQPVTISQVATTGTNALSFNGGIVSTGGTQLVTFAGAGAINVAGNSIVNGSGTIAVSKTGAGTTNLANANTYSGGTTVSGGILQLGNATALGSQTGALIVNTGGVLDLNGNNQTVGSFSGSGGQIGNSQSGTVTLTIGSGDGAGSFAGVIADHNTGSGVVSLTKSGNGIETLSNASTYSGGTLVSGGALNITNASGSATGSAGVTVSGGSAAVFSGTGISSGALNVTGGSVLAAGNNDATNFNQVGKLVVGSTGGATLTNAVLDFDLSSATAALGASNDLLQTNTLTLGSGLTFDFNEIGGSLLTGTQYTLFQDTAAISNFDAGHITTLFNNGRAYTPTYSVAGNNLNVTFDSPSAAPEPAEMATLALIGLGLGGLLLRARKRRASAVEGSAS